MGVTPASHVLKHVIDGKKRERSWCDRKVNLELHGCRADQQQRVSVPHVDLQRVEGEVLQEPRPLSRLQQRGVCQERHFQPWGACLWEGNQPFSISPKMSIPHIAGERCKLFHGLAQTSAPRTSVLHVWAVRLLNMNRFLRPMTSTQPISGNANHILAVSYLTAVCRNAFFFVYICDQLSIMRYVLNTGNLLL